MLSEASENVIEGVNRESVELPIEMRLAQQLNPKVDLMGSHE